MLLAACTPVSGNLDPAPLSPEAAAPGVPGYRLQPGDVLEIHARRNPELEEQVVVAPDGQATFQYAPGIPAGGHTLAEVNAAVLKSYAAQLRDPQIIVTLRSSAGTHVYVTGEVGTPTEIVETGQLSALSAISRAGGFKLTALTSEIVLVRRDPNNKAHLFAVDLSDVTSGEAAEKDVLLANYDVLYVPRDRAGNVSLLFERIRNAIPFGASLTYGLSQGALF